MERGQLSTDNGRSRHAIERRPQAGVPEPDGGAGLGDVVKDAIDHVSVIVSDSVALGKLEAKRVVGRVEQTTKEVAPRVAAGAMAAIFGFVGGVFALIAIFIALGEVIPSVAVRLAIYAAFFLVLAAVGGFFAARGIKETRTDTLRAHPPSDNALAQTKPVA